MINPDGRSGSEIGHPGVNGRKACWNDSSLSIVSQKCASYRKRGRAENNFLHPARAGESKRCEG